MCVSSARIIHKKSSERFMFDGERASAGIEKGFYHHLPSFKDNSVLLGKRCLSKLLFRSKQFVYTIVWFRFKLFLLF